MAVGKASCFGDWPRLCQNASAARICSISGVIRPSPTSKQSNTAHSERSIFLVSILVEFLHRLGRNRSMTIRCSLHFTSNYPRSLSDLRLIYCASGKNGPYFPVFLLHRPTMRLKNVKICPRSPTRLATIAQVRQAPRIMEAMVDFIRQDVLNTRSGYPFVTQHHAHRVAFQASVSAVCGLLSAPGWRPGRGCASPAFP